MGGRLVLDKKLLGQYIKNHRIKKHLTQAELAEIINVAVGMIGQYERGKKAPSRDKLFELAQVLEFSLDDLFLKPELTDKSIFSDDFVKKFNQLTVTEQKAVLKVAEAVVDTFLNK